MEVKNADLPVRHTQGEIGEGIGPHPIHGLAEYGETVRGLQSRPAPSRGRSFVHGRKFPLFDCASSFPPKDQLGCRQFQFHVVVERDDASHTEITEQGHAGVFVLWKSLIDFWPKFLSKVYASLLVTRLFNVSCHIE